MTDMVPADADAAEVVEEMRVVFRRFRGGTPFGTFGHNHRFVVVLPLDPIPECFVVEAGTAYRYDNGGFFLFPHDDGGPRLVANLFHGHSGGWDRWNYAVLALTTHGFHVREE